MHNRDSYLRSRPPFPRSRVALGILAMAAALQAQAQAQAQPEAAPASTATPVPVPKTGEETVIVVTGFRASLNSALNLKKNSDGIVDVIKA